MNSRILNSMGIGTIDPMIFILLLLVFIIGLCIWLIVTNSKLKKITQKYERFMQGKNLESMEELLMERFEEMSKMLDDTSKNTQDIKSLIENMEDTVQKIGIVKYDAFHEMGGKLSFALAMLNGKNYGYIINAMQSREGCYTYIKEIINGESYIPLGTEETQALNQALGREEEDI